MANLARGVNPEILRWARVRAGYSIQEIAYAFKKTTDEISQWEDGSSVPTYNQLERLAYTFYKRPLALFFFPSPPEELEPREEFRTLPDFEIDRLQPDTRLAIREAQARQIALRELSDGKNPSERLVFREFSLHPLDSVPEAAFSLRQYLGVSVSEQSRWPNPRTALANWREIIQDVGVFVFKRPFKQKDVSGLCLFDPEFPVIYLSSSTAKTRQIFTLFHELAHILLRASGITKTDDSYITSLSGESRQIEVFTNAFAAEFLVPSQDLENRLDPQQLPEDIATNLSRFYNVSREVILRKLLERGLVERGFYRSISRQWIEEYEAKSGRGGNYYANQAAYLGDKYMSLAFSRFYEGRLSLQDLADYLNIKARSIEGLERRMLGRAMPE